MMSTVPGSSVVWYLVTSTSYLVLTVVPSLSTSSTRLGSSSVKFSKNT